MKNLFLLFTACILCGTLKAQVSVPQAKVYEGIAPAICPRPVKAEINNASYLPLQTVTIVCQDDKAVGWTEKHLKEWYGDHAPKVKTGNKDNLPKEEGAYTLETGNKGVTICASTLQGIRYGLFTMRQLAIPARGTATVQSWIIPETAVEDKPALSFRGMHICWFRETEAWEVERMIRLAAYYKMNYAVVEAWGTFRSQCAPWFGWPDGKMTHEEITRLKAIADDLGVTLIPGMNIFGHATSARGGAGKHATLDFGPEYQTLFEPHNGWNWCLSNPNARKVISNLLCELLDAFGRPPYIHIGCDEAEKPSCPACMVRPYGELFVEHVKAISDAVKKHGAHAMMWHDMLLEAGDARWAGFYANGTKATASVVSELDKGIIICDWFYSGPKDTYPTLDYFKELGYTVLTCPWTDANGTRAQGKYASEHGIDGLLGTTWHHFFGQDLCTAYVGAANAAWNPGQAPDGQSYFHTHLRQMGWDMKANNPDQTGIYYFDVPTQPTLNN